MSFLCVRFCEVAVSFTDSLCQTGCKQSTMKTYLQDAADAGARFVVGARADRVLTADGVARGVEAT
ncbi:MAG TPA: GMC family oxidoreductase N-terminal domain-containing protein, partial [Solirubrobacteraceae bacterium]|nr:GMC family oxidoreductase N-terminal domain-containing protein [Solirubrobacteraceae bacterium]